MNFVGVNTCAIFGSGTLRVLGLEVAEAELTARCTVK